MKKIIQSFCFLAIPLLIFQGCGSREIKKQASMNDLLKMSIMKENWGKVDNKDVFLYSLKNKNGIVVKKFIKESGIFISWYLITVLENIWRTARISCFNRGRCQISAFTLSIDTRSNWKNEGLCSKSSGKSYQSRNKGIDWTSQTRLFGVSFMRQEWKKCKYETIFWSF